MLSYIILIIVFEPSEIIQTIYYSLGLISHFGLQIYMQNYFNVTIAFWNYNHKKTDKFDNNNKNNKNEIIMEILNNHAENENHCKNNKNIKNESNNSSIVKTHMQNNNNNNTTYVTKSAIVYCY